MHVLFITGEFPPMQGGVGDCTNEIALALTKRGIHVSVLTSIHAHSVLSPQSSVLQVLPVIKKWDWSALSQIRRAISETRADIFHIQYQTGAFGMHPMINFAPRLLSSVRKGVRSVVTFHDLRPMYLFPKAGRLRDWVTFQLAHTTDAVIATNDQDYVTLFALNLKLLTCIPIGSNIDPTPPPDFNRAALRAQLGVQRDENLLCYFGFLNDSKGGETLIRALTEIPNAKLLMLGGQTGASDATNAAYLKHVKKRIAELNLTHRVIWTDFLSQPQVSAHFLASDMCVLPYRDGASFRRGTFMAALAHGMAIVTTEDGGQETRNENRGMGKVGRETRNEKRESGDGVRLPVLRDGENVLLVPPDDPHEIAEAVKRIASSSELRARLQQGARETAQFFTWDKIADAHLELYQKLV
jgi:glycosyltransferase involved in cell wall biosynthesis